MQGPGDPVESSLAPTGDVAEEPEDAGDISVVEVSDQDGDAVGLFLKWDSAEWLYADIVSYRSLEDAR